MSTCNSLTKHFRYGVTGFIVIVPILLLIFASLPDTAVGQSKKDLDREISAGQAVTRARKRARRRSNIRILNLRFMYPEGGAVQDLKVSLKRPSAVATTTNAEGRVKLSFTHRPTLGDEIGITIVKMPVGANLAFVSPWNAMVALPSSQNSSTVEREIILVEYGVRTALENSKVRAAIARAIVDALSFRKEKEPNLELGDAIEAAISSAARSRGWDPADVRSKLEEFGEASADPYERSVSAFLRGDYAAAEKALLESNQRFDQSVAQEYFSRFSFLGKIYYAQGKYQEAVDAFLNANAYKPDDIKNLNNLGLAKALVGDVDGGRYFIKKAQQLAQQATNAQTDLFESLNTLGGLALQQSAYDEARAKFGEAKELVEKEIKLAKSPELVEKLSRANSNLGSLFLVERKFPEAKESLDRAIAILQSEFGSETDRIAYILPSLAAWYAQQGQKSKAIETLNRALTLNESRLGKDHPILVNILNNLGGEYSEIGDHAQAETMLRRALRIATLDSQRAIVLTTLGFSYSRQGRLQDAELVLKQAADVYEDACLEKSLFESNTFTLLGGAYFLQQKCAEAIPAWHKALEIRTALLAPDDPLRAQAHNNYARGLSCKSVERYAEAEYHYKEALRIYGPFISEHVAKTLENYAEMLTEMKRAGEAREFADRAATMRKTIEQLKKEGLFRPGI